MTSTPPSGAADAFAELFDHVPVGLYRTTADGRIVEANLAMVHLLGCASKDDLFARTAQSFYVDPDARRAVKAELAATGVLRDFETEMRRVDGRRIWVRINAHAVRDPHGPGEVAQIDGAMEDVTERLKAEAALRESEERLRQSQKMEAIGRLAGGVAHDFNNLLTAIIGYSSLLAEDEALAAEARESAMEISKAAERAASLTQQLLAVSRRQVLQPAEIDPDEVITAMVPMLRRLIGEDVVLTTTLDGGGAVVRADRGQLEQVLLNLCLNARDAMPNGGSLVIASATTRLDAAEAAGVSGLHPGEYVVIDVADNGVGMTDQVRARIFDPYFTTKPPGKGTGLGLSTVYGIAQQSGGAVVCASAPGAGTTMRTYLPRIVASAPPTTAERVAVRAVGHETILVAEDEDVVRSFAVHALVSRGYTVLAAADGAEALALAERHDGPIDLVLTDVVMPGMNGGALAAALQAARPGIAVLYMSGHASDALARYGVATRAASLLLKPFTPDMLGEKVRGVLAAAAPRGPA